jgi:predicted phage terminase large subunit-like protein
MARNPAQLTCPGVRRVTPSQSKPDRITAMSSVFEAGRVCLPRQAPWLGPCEREFRAFPLGRNDDMLDAMAYALNAALKVLATPAMVYFGPYNGRCPREVV